MAKIPPKLGLRSQDFSDKGINDRDTLDQLFGPLNSRFSDINDLVSQSMTFGANFNCEVKKFNIQTPQTDWVTLTGQNSFTANAGGTGNQGVPAVRKDRNGIVWGQGTFGGGSLATVATNLPAGYRPAQVVTVGVNAGNAPGAITVAPNGDVYLYSGSTSWFSLYGMMFTSGDRLPGVLSCFPITLKTSIASPRGFIILSIKDVTSGATSGTGDPALALGLPDWAASTSGLTIKNLPGLRLNRKYEVTALILPEQG